MYARHITNGIRSAAIRRLRGFGRLGHSAALHSNASLHPHYASPGLAPQALIRAGNVAYNQNVMRNTALNY